MAYVQRAKSVYVGNKPRADCAPHWMYETLPHDGWFHGFCIKCDRYCEIKTSSEWVTNSFKCGKPDDWDDE
jgi:hypothetical protein